MALNEGSSFVVSSIVSLLLFSGMQMFKTVLASTQMMTILAGFTGSILYVFLLTAVANLEKSIFGFNFQTKLGEVRLGWTVTKNSLKDYSKLVQSKVVEKCDHDYIHGFI